MYAGGRKRALLAQVLRQNPAAEAACNEHLALWESALTGISGAHGNVMQLRFVAFFAANMHKDTTHVGISDTGRPFAVSVLYPVLTRAARLLKQAIDQCADPTPFLLVAYLTACVSIDKSQQSHRAPDTPRDDLLSFVAAVRAMEASAIRLIETFDRSFHAGRHRFPFEELCFLSTQDPFLVQACLEALEQWTLKLPFGRAGTALCKRLLELSHCVAHGGAANENTWKAVLGKLGPRHTRRSAELLVWHARPTVCVPALNDGCGTAQPPAPPAAASDAASALADAGATPNAPVVSASSDPFGCLSVSEFEVCLNRVAEGLPPEVVWEVLLDPAHQAQAARDSTEVREREPAEAQRVVGRGWAQEIIGRYLYGDGNEVCIRRAENVIRYEETRVADASLVSGRIQSMIAADDLPAFQNAEYGGRLDDGTFVFISAMHELSGLRLYFVRRTPRTGPGEPNSSTAATQATSSANNHTRRSIEPAAEGTTPSTPVGPTAAEGGGGGEVQPPEAYDETVAMHYAFRDGTRNQPFTAFACSALETLLTLPPADDFEGKLASAFSVLPDFRVQLMAHLEKSSLRSYHPMTVARLLRACLENSHEGYGKFFGEGGVLVMQAKHRPGVNLISLLACLYEMELPIQTFHSVAVVKNVAKELHPSKLSPIWILKTLHDSTRTDFDGPWNWHLGYRGKEYTHAFVIAGHHVMLTHPALAVGEASALAYQERDAVFTITFTKELPGMAGGCESVSNRVVEGSGEAGNATASVTARPQVAANWRCASSSGDGDTEVAAEGRAEQDRFRLAASSSHRPPAGLSRRVRPVLDVDAGASASQLVITVKLMRPSTPNSGDRPRTIQGSFIDPSDEDTELSSFFTVTPPAEATVPSPPLPRWGSSAVQNTSKMLEDTATGWDASKWQPPASSRALVCKIFDQRPLPDDGAREPVDDFILRFWKLLCSQFLHVHKGVNTSLDIDSWAVDASEPAEKLLALQGLQRAAAQVVLETYTDIRKVDWLSIPVDLGRLEELHGGYPTVGRLMARVKDAEEELRRRVQTHDISHGQFARTVENEKFRAACLANGTSLHTALNFQQPIRVVDRNARILLALIDRWGVAGAGRLYDSLTAAYQQRENLPLAKLEEHADTSSAVLAPVLQYQDATASPLLQAHFTALAGQATLANFADRFEQTCARLRAMTLETPVDEASAGLPPNDGNYNAGKRLQEATLLESVGCNPAVIEALLEGALPLRFMIHDLRSFRALATGACEELKLHDAFFESSETFLIDLTTAGMPLSAAKEQVARITHASAGCEHRSLQVIKTTLQCPALVKFTRENPEAQDAGLSSVLSNSRDLQHACFQTFLDCCHYINPFVASSAKHVALYKEQKQKLAEGLDPGAILRNPLNNSSSWPDDEGSSPDVKSGFWNALQNAFGDTGSHTVAAVQDMLMKMSQPDQIEELEKMIKEQNGTTDKLIEQCRVIAGIPLPEPADQQPSPKQPTPGTVVIELPATGQPVLYCSSPSGSWTGPEYQDLVYRATLQCDLSALLKTFVDQAREVLRAFNAVCVVFAEGHLEFRSRKLSFLHDDASRITSILQALQGQWVGGFDGKRTTSTEAGAEVVQDSVFFAASKVYPELACVPPSQLVRMADLLRSACSVGDMTIESARQLTNPWRPTRVNDVRRTAAGCRSVDLAQCLPATPIAAGHPPPSTALPHSAGRDPQCSETLLKLEGAGCASGDYRQGLWTYKRPDGAALCPVQGGWVLYEGAAHTGAQGKAPRRLLASLSSNVSTLMPWEMGDWREADASGVLNPEPSLDVSVRLDDAHTRPVVWPMEPKHTEEVLSVLGVRELAGLDVEVADGALWIAFVDKSDALPWDSLGFERGMQVVAVDNERPAPAAALRELLEKVVKGCRPFTVTVVSPWVWFPAADVAVSPGGKKATKLGESREPSIVSSPATEDTWRVRVSGDVHEMRVGLCGSDFQRSASGDESGAAVWYMRCGLLRKQGADLACANPYRSGDVLAVHYDRVARTVLFSLNGEQQAGPVDAAALGEFPHPVVMLHKASCAAEISGGCPVVGVHRWKTTRKGSVVSFEDDGATVRRHDKDTATFGAAIGDTVFRGPGPHAFSLLLTGRQLSDCFFGVAPPGVFLDKQYDDETAMVGLTMRSDGSFFGLKQNKILFSSRRMQALATNDVLTFVLDLGLGYVEVLKNGQRLLHSSMIEDLPRFTGPLVPYCYLAQPDVKCTLIPVKEPGLSQMVPMAIVKGREYTERTAAAAHLQGEAKGNDARLARGSPDGVYDRSTPTYIRQDGAFQIFHWNNRWCVADQADAPVAWSDECDAGVPLGSKAVIWTLVDGYQTTPPRLRLHHHTSGAGALFQLKNAGADSNVPRSSVYATDDRNGNPTLRWTLSYHSSLQRWAVTDVEGRFVLVNAEDTLLPHHSASWMAGDGAGRWALNPAVSLSALQAESLRYDGSAGWWTEAEYGCGWGDLPGQVVRVAEPLRAKCSLEAIARAVGGSVGWKCPACVAVNEAARLTCNACSAPRSASSCPPLGDDLCHEELDSMTAQELVGWHVVHNAIGASCSAAELRVALKEVAKDSLSGVELVMHWSSKEEAVAAVRESAQAQLAMIGQLFNCLKKGTRGFAPLAADNYDPAEPKFGQMQSKTIVGNTVDVSRLSPADRRIFGLSLFKGELQPFHALDCSPATPPEEVRAMIVLYRLLRRGRLVLLNLQDLAPDIQNEVRKATEETGDEKQLIALITKTTGTVDESVDFVDSQACDMRWRKAAHARVAALKKFESILFFDQPPGTGKTYSINKLIADGHWGPLTPTLLDIDATKTTMDDVCGRLTSPLRAKRGLLVVNVAHDAEPAFVNHVLDGISVLGRLTSPSGLTVATPRSGWHLAVEFQTPPDPIPGHPSNPPWRRVDGGSDITLLFCRGFADQGTLAPYHIDEAGKRALSFLVNTLGITPPAQKPAAQGGAADAYDYELILRVFALGLNAAECNFQDPASLALLKRETGRASARLLTRSLRFLTWQYEQFCSIKPDSNTINEKEKCHFVAVSQAHEMRHFVDPLRIDHFHLGVHTRLHCASGILLSGSVPPEIAAARLQFQEALRKTSPGAAAREAPSPDDSDSFETMHLYRHIGILSEHLRVNVSLTARTLAKKSYVLIPDFLQKLIQLSSHVELFDPVVIQGPSGTGKTYAVAMLAELMQLPTKDRTKPCRDFVKELYLFLRLNPDLRRIFPSGVSDQIGDTVRPLWKAECRAAYEDCDSCCGLLADRQCLPGLLLISEAVKDLIAPILRGNTDPDIVERMKNHVFRDAVNYVLGSRSPPADDLLAQQNPAFPCPSNGAGSNADSYNGSNNNNNSNSGDVEANGGGALVPDVAADAQRARGCILVLCKELSKLSWGYLVDQLVHAIETVLRSRKMEELLGSHFKLILSILDRNHKLERALDWARDAVPRAGAYGGVLTKLVREHMRSAIASSPLLKPKPELIELLALGDGPTGPDGNELAELIRLFVAMDRETSLVNILMRYDMTPDTLFNELRPILEKALQSPTIRFTVMIDEMNATCMLGLLKRLVVDRIWDKWEAIHPESQGVIPGNVAFVGAMNPPKKDCALEGDAVDDAAADERSSLRRQQLLPPQRAASSSAAAEEGAGAADEGSGDSPVKTLADRETAEEPAGLRPQSASPSHSCPSADTDDEGDNEEESGDAEDSLGFDVTQMPPSLMEHVVPWRQLAETQREMFISRLIASNKNLYRHAYLPEETIQTLGYILLQAHRHVQKIYVKKRSTVSQRDIHRSMKVFDFFFARGFDFINFNGDETTDLRDRALSSMLLGVAVSYYFRLSHTDRAVLSRTMTNLLRDRSDAMRRLGKEVRPLPEGVDFALVVARAVNYFCGPHLNLPEAVHVHKGLMENLFVQMICFHIRLAVILHGPPGTSKTLSNNIIRDNMTGRGDVWNTLCSISEVCRYQGSAQSSANEIKKKCEEAMQGQRNHDAHGHRNKRCLLFVDEAGLVKGGQNERKWALKVLHYYLESANIASVLMTNQALDPAIGNRCVEVYMAKPRPKELSNMCAGILHKDGVDGLSLKVRRLVPACCKAFHTLLGNSADPSKSAYRWWFGLRDLFHMMRFIKRHNATPDAPLIDIPPALAAHALERNFNGPKPMFETVVDVFGALLGEIDPEFSAENLRKHLRKKLDVVIDSIVDNNRAREGTSAKNLNDMWVRFKLLVDNTDDGTILHMLKRSRVAQFEGVKVLSLSVFSRDDELMPVTVVSQITAAMETGKTVWLTNTRAIDACLFDVYNQSYVVASNGRGEILHFVAVAIGAALEYKRVHRDFQCIVHVTKQELEGMNDVLPSPFLNRLEKFTLNVSEIVEFAAQRVATPALELTVRNLRQLLGTFLDAISSSTRCLFSDNAGDTLDSLLLESLQQEAGGVRPVAVAPRLAGDEALRGFFHPPDPFTALFRTLSCRLLQLCLPEGMLLAQNVLREGAPAYLRAYFRNLRPWSLTGYFTALVEHVAGDAAPGGWHRSVVYTPANIEFQSLLKDHPGCQYKSVDALLKTDRGQENLVEALYRLCASSTHHVLIVSVSPELAGSVEAREVRYLLETPPDARVSSKAVVLLQAVNPQLGKPCTPLFASGWDQLYIDAAAENVGTDLLQYVEPSIVGKRPSKKLPEWADMSNILDLAVNELMQVQGEAQLMWVDVADDDPAAMLYDMKRSLAEHVHAARELFDTCPKVRRTLLELYRARLPTPQELMSLAQEVCSREKPSLSLAQRLIDEENKAPRALLASALRMLLDNRNASRILLSQHSQSPAERRRLETSDDIIARALRITLERTTFDQLRGSRLTSMPPLTVGASMPGLAGSAALRELLPIPPDATDAVKEAERLAREHGEKTPTGAAVALVSSDPQLVLHFFRDCVRVRVKHNSEAVCQQLVDSILELSRGLHLSVFQAPETVFSVRSLCEVEGRVIDGYIRSMLPLAVTDALKHAEPPWGLHKDGRKELSWIDEEHAPDILATVAPCMLRGGETEGKGLAQFLTAASSLLRRVDPANAAKSSVLPAIAVAACLLTPSGDPDELPPTPEGKGGVPHDDSASSHLAGLSGKRSLITSVLAFMSACKSLSSVRPAIDVAAIELALACNPSASSKVAFVVVKHAMQIQSAYALNTLVPFGIRLLTSTRVPRGIACRVLSMVLPPLPLSPDEDVDSSEQGRPSVVEPADGAGPERRLSKKRSLPAGAGTPPEEGLSQGAGSFVKNPCDVCDPVSEGRRASFAQDLARCIYAAAAQSRGGRRGGPGVAEGDVGPDEAYSYEPPGPRQTVASILQSKAYTALYDSTVDQLMGLDAELLSAESLVPLATGYLRQKGAVAACSRDRRSREGLAALLFAQVQLTALEQVFVAALGRAFHRQEDEVQWEPAFMGRKRDVALITKVSRMVFEPPGFVCPQRGSDEDALLMTNPKDLRTEGNILAFINTLSAGVGVLRGMGTKGMLEYLKDQVSTEGSPGAMVRICGEAMRHKFCNAEALATKPGDLPFVYQLDDPLHDMFHSLRRQFTLGMASPETAPRTVDNVLNKLRSIAAMVPVHKARLLLFYCSLKCFFAEDVAHPMAYDIAFNPAIQTLLELNEKQQQLLHTALDRSALPTIDGVQPVFAAGFNTDWAEVVCAVWAIGAAMPDTFLGSLLLDIDPQRGHYLPGDKTGGPIAYGGNYKFDCVTQLDSKGNLDSYGSNQPVLSTGACYLLWCVEFTSLVLQLVFFPSSFTTVWEWFFSPTLHARVFKYQENLSNYEHIVNQLTERSTAYHFHMGAATGLSVDEAQRMFAFFLYHYISDDSGAVDALRRVTNDSREAALGAEKVVEGFWKQMMTTHKSSLTKPQGDMCQTLKALDDWKELSRPLNLPRSGESFLRLECLGGEERPKLLGLVYHEHQKLSLVAPLLLDILGFAERVHRLLSNRLPFKTAGENSSQETLTPYRSVLSLFRSVTSVAQLRMAREQLFRIKRAWNEFRRNVGPIDFECEEGGINISMPEDEEGLVGSAGFPDTLDFWVTYNESPDPNHRNLVKAAILSLTSKYNKSQEVVASYVPLDFIDIDPQLLDPSRLDLCLRETNCLPEICRSHMFEHRDNNEVWSVDWAEIEKEVAFASGMLLPRLIVPQCPIFEYREPEEPLSVASAEKAAVDLLTVQPDRHLLPIPPDRLEALRRHTADFSDDQIAAMLSGLTSTFEARNTQPTDNLHEAVVSRWTLGTMPIPLASSRMEGLTVDHTKAVIEFFLQKLDNCDWLTSHISKDFCAEMEPHLLAAVESNWAAYLSQTQVSEVVDELESMLEALIDTLENPEYLTPNGDLMEFVAAVMMTSSSEGACSVFRQTQMRHVAVLTRRVRKEISRLKTQISNKTWAEPGAEVSEVPFTVTPDGSPLGIDYDACGAITLVNHGSPADNALLAPGMKIVSVAGRSAKSKAAIDSLLHSEQLPPVFEIGVERRVPGTDEADQGGELARSPLEPPFRGGKDDAADADPAAAPSSTSSEAGAHSSLGPDDKQAPAAENKRSAPAANDRATGHRRRRPANRHDEKS